MSNEAFTSFLRPRGWLICWLRIALAVLLGATPGGLRAQAPESELRTAAAVRALTVEEAQQHKPVRLRGVVTFFEERLFSRFIQDETSGVYLFDSALPLHFTPGQLVEVEGSTSAGEYAPIVVPKVIRLIAESTLPAAKQVTYEELAGGRQDSQFVEIAGIVRSVQFSESTQYYLIEITTGGGRLSVYAGKLPVERTEELPDSTVRVRGVCSTQFNHQRQLFAIRLMVPRAEDLLIETKAPIDTFATAARPIGSLLQFRPQESYGHRVKVEGTIIYHEAGKVLFLQDGDQGLEVQTKAREPLALGDRVEALGFVGQGDYTPVLQDAVFRKKSSGTPPLPVSVSPDEALKGTHDCQLITVAAKLLDRALDGPERYLILQESNLVFHAYLSRTDGRDPFAGLENGSRVSVTGVCRIDPGEWLAGEDWRAKSFRLQMRSIADVTLLESPSWWTLRKVLGMAVTVGAVALVAFSWVVVLRRKVVERTRQLEAQILERQRAERQRLIEQERTRVAQDLHDELGATLTEVGILGTLARTSSLPMSERERYLEKLTNTSRAVVATLDEIVWAVNPKYDSVASLASYYSLFAQRFLNLAGIACRLRVAETFPAAPLESRVRHGVFLAFKEALNNAVCHSGASQILIELEVVGNQLKIAVADNGRGFEPVDCQPGSDGMAGMKERMAKLGGGCKIKSAPEKGTTVEFWLPLEYNAP